MQRERIAVWIIVAALLAMTLVGVAVVSPIGADDPGDDADRTITVQAVGSADGSPDRATVRVGITATGEDPAAVRDELATESDAFIAALESLGISEEKYETTSYRIDENHRRPTDSRELPAYRGVHTFEVTLEEPDRSGDVIDAAAESNAEINDIRFTLSEERRNELRSKAIETAMSDARSQAESIATGADLHITGVYQVEAAQREGRPVSYEAQAAAGAGSAPETAIETGDVSVQYRVTVTYNATAGTP